MIKPVLQTLFLIILIMGFDVETARKRVCVVMSVEIDFSLSELNGELEKLEKEEYSPEYVSEYTDKFYQQLRSRLCKTST